MAVIRDLADLAALDKHWPAIATARQVFEDHPDSDSARLEISRLEKDDSFMKRWISGDAESVLIFRSLQRVVDWDARPVVVGQEAHDRAEAEQKKVREEMGL